MMSIPLLLQTIPFQLAQSCWRALFVWVGSLLVFPAFGLQPLTFLSALGLVLVVRPLITGTNRLVCNASGGTPADAPSMANLFADLVARSAIVAAQHKHQNKEEPDA